MLEFFMCLTGWPPRFGSVFVRGIVRAVPVIGSDGSGSGYDS